MEAVAPPTRRPRRPLAAAPTRPWLSPASPQGLERFKVTRVVRERPVLICEVEVLPEDGDDGQEVRGASACVCACVSSFVYVLGGLW